jgi:phospholipid-binding lipoprotein MlaA
MGTTKYLRTSVVVSTIVLAFYVWGTGTPLAIAQSDGSSSAQPYEDPGIKPDSTEEQGYVPPEEDPWEGFNETMFNFNRKVDRYVLKPVATGYDFVLPRPVQTGIRNAIDNIDVIRRLLNNLLQAKFTNVGTELARFTINSTIGGAGLVDVAKLGFGIEQADEDTGQTFGVWGLGSGPYLVLPFLPVTTVRDGVGTIFDKALNPLLYVSLFVDRAEWVSTGVFALNTANNRSLNLETFEQIEETVIDLYGAVRNGYLQTREAAIKE